MSPPLSISCCPERFCIRSISIVAMFAFIGKLTKLSKFFFFCCELNPYFSFSAEPISEMLSERALRRLLVCYCSDSKAFVGVLVLYPSIASIRDSLMVL